MEIVEGVVGPITASQMMVEKNTPTVQVGANRKAHKMTTVTDSIARAKTFDPETSHIAARKVRNMTETKAAIMVLLREEPSTDENLVDRFRKGIRSSRLPFASPSGIRTRRNELAVDGHLTLMSERHLLESGNYGDVWRVTK
jgi:hypothetical protein